MDKNGSKRDSTALNQPVLHNQNAHYHHQKEVYLDGLDHTQRSPSSLSPTSSIQLSPSSSINASPASLTPSSSISNYAAARDADAIANEDETPNPNKGALVILLLTIFLQSTGFSIVLPSLLLYVNSEGGSIVFVGWINACYSLAAFCASPVLGWWSNHRPAREVLIASLLISVAANVLYALAADFPSAPTFILIARIIAGIGSGNVSVCRAYVSHATTLKNRTTYMSMMSAAQGLGFAIGPAMGASLAFINFKVSIFVFNEYTAVGYMSAVLLLLDAVMLVIIGLPELSRAHADSNEEYKVPMRELVPIAVVISLFFVICGIYAVFETMCTKVTKDSFGWDDKRGIFKNGVLFLGTAIISIITYIVISLPAVTRRVSDRQMLVFSWLVNLASLALLGNLKFIERKLPLGQFVAGVALMSVGYPMASSLIYSLFSKVVHPRAQGTKMGWLTGFGSLARMLAPLWGSFAYTQGGNALLFWITAGTVVIALVVTFAFYKVLVPHLEYSKPNPDADEVEKLLKPEGDDQIEYR